MRHSNRNPRCRRGTILPAILAIFLWGAIQSAWCAGESPRAEVRPHSGRPTLLIDGRAHSGLSASTYTPIIKDFKELSAIGLDIHCFSTTADYSLYGLAAPCWTGPGQYDYTQLDERARMVLKADPNNMIIPRIYIAAPGWWLDQHPDEVCVFGDGSSKLNYTPGGGAIPPGGELRVPSMASRLWRETTKDNLRRLIDHIEAQDYGKRVIGYHLASGITEEWMYWGYQLNQLGDYSKPAREGFRWWLKNKYKSDAGLRKAWHRPAITLATAAVPSDAARRTSGEGILLNPAKSQDIVDYNFYLSDMVVDTIGEFAHAVKEHTKRTKLIGVFYGYVMELSWDRNAIPPSGHLAIDRMLTSPDIDFFSAPSSYSARQPATGFSAFMSLTDSFRLHGKLLVDENDYRTHLAQDKTAVFGYVNNLEQGLGQQWREFGNVLAHGVGMWWFNMGGGWYSDPKLLAEMKRMREAGVRSVELPFASTAQIAVVVDPATPNWLTHTETYHGLALQRGKAEWARLGAPYAIMSLKDYAQGLGGPYRMAIFANLLRVEPKTTKAIRRRLNKERTLAVWQYAPGYLSDEGYSVKGIERLTGFRIKRLDPPTTESLSVRVLPQAVVGRKGALPDGAGFKIPLPLDPFFTVEADGAKDAGSPKGAKIFGIYEGPEAVKNRGALAWRQGDGHHEIYAAVPLLSAEILRALAREAGVHLYTAEPETIQANQNWVGIHAAKSGTHTIRLPKRSRIESVARPRLVADSASEFSFPLNAGESELFLIQPTGVRTAIPPMAKAKIEKPR